MRLSLSHSMRAGLALALAVLFTMHVAPGSTNASAAPPDAVAHSYRHAPDASATVASHADDAGAINFTTASDAATPAGSRATRVTAATHSPAGEIGADSRIDRPVAETRQEHESAARNERVTTVKSAAQRRGGERGYRVKIPAREHAADANRRRSEPASSAHAAKTNGAGNRPALAKIRHTGVLKRARATTRHELG